MSWTPLDDGLLTSTLLAEGPTSVAIFILLLASSDRYGVSKLQPTAAASLLRIKDEEAEAAFRKLQDGDPKSRNKAERGARIVKNEDGYWQIVSFEKYRNLSSRQKAAQRQAEYIRRKKANSQANLDRGDDRDDEEF